MKPFDPDKIYVNHINIVCGVRHALDTAAHSKPYDACRATHLPCFLRSLCCPALGTFGLVGGVW